MTIINKILAIVLSCCVRILEKFSNLLFSFIYRNGKENLPAIENEILLQPAVEITKNIRERKYRCVDVIQAFIKRIGDVNGVVNAVVADRFQSALEEARDIDLALDSGEPLPEKYSLENAPLLGVPFTAKEAFAIEGLSNCSGLVSRAHVKAESDAASVTLLRQAGAIPLALTNCSELCMWYESANLVYGRTRNAYDTRRIVGGSSGGEGCIISCAGSVFGIGSDIGGSIRMPAFFNGIFGHKPTAGIVPNGGQFPNAQDKQAEFLVTGPMCRYAADLIPTFKALAKPNLHKLHLDDKVDVSAVRFVYMMDDGGSPVTSRVHPDLVLAQQRVISHLRAVTHATGSDAVDTARVTAVTSRYMYHSLEIWSAMMAASESPTFRELMEDGGAGLSPWRELVKAVVLRSSRHTLPAIALALTEGLPRRNPDRLAKLCRAAARLAAEWDELLAGDTVLLYPSHPLPAPYHNQPLCLPFNFSYTAIFNVLGLPVTQCALGLGETSRLPVGIQLVARKHMDHLTIAVAAELERAFGGWVTPTDVNI